MIFINQIPRIKAQHSLSLEAVLSHRCDENRDGGERASPETRVRRLPPKRGQKDQKDKEAKNDKKRIGSRRMVVLGLAAAVLFLGSRMIGGEGVKKAPRHAARKTPTAVESQEAYLAAGDRVGLEEDRTSGGGSEASSAGGPVVDPDSITRDLVTRVLEGGEEDRREVVTAKFLDDLRYNLAILGSADLSRLQAQARGFYALEALAAYQLPQGSAGEPGKEGRVRMLISFMDGGWKLHDLKVQ